MQDMMIETYYLLRQSKIEFSARILNDLDEFKKAIDCDLIEEVPTVIDDVVLLIDEEGKLKGKGINRVATMLYPHGYADPIVGNALAVGVDGDHYRSLTIDEKGQISSIRLREDGSFGRK